MSSEDNEPPTTTLNKIDTWALKHKERIIIWTSLGCFVISLIDLLIRLIKS